VKTQTKKVDQSVKYKSSIFYASIGVVFGLSFPIIATLVETIGAGLSLTLENFGLIQAQNHLLWIIDTAPFFLGIFAGLAGLRQDRLDQQNTILQVEILARQRAFEEIEILKNNLEQEVLARKVLQLKASTEIGYTIASLRDLDTLVSEVTNLISDHLGFFHTGIFLLDDLGEFAVLKAASSEGGKRMLARDHKLLVGGTSIVGYVTSQREARIAQDVDLDNIYFDNPDLPDTLSEMALPLIVEGKLLGALDIQSERIKAFDDDDILVLQTLANQVALAIENTRSFDEQQTSLESIQREYGEKSRQAWQGVLEKSELGFISSDTFDIQLTEKDWTPEMRETVTTGEITSLDDDTIHIPIILREQTLGVIRLRKREGTGSWLDEEIELMDTLVDQLETALETARLYSDTQTQAERERLTHEVTNKLHRSPDMDALMQTLLQEISTALGASSSFIQLTTDQQSSDENLGTQRGTGLLPPLENRSDPISKPEEKSE